MGYLIPQLDKDTTSQNYWRAMYARDFIEGEYWVGLGRKDTDWQFNANPPDATVGTRPIEVLGYRKVNYRTLVVPDQDAGTLSWRNLRLTPVASNLMFRKINGIYPRWAFLQTTITTSELPVNQYFRQIFIYTDLVPKNQWSNFEWLTPGQVDDVGNLIYIENIPRMYRLSNQIEVIAFLFEF